MSEPVPPSDPPPPERPLPKSLLPLSPDVKNTVLEDIKDDPEGTFIHDTVDLFKKQEAIHKYMATVGKDVPAADIERRRNFREGVIRGWAFINEQSIQAGIPVVEVTSAHIGSVLGETIAARAKDPNRDLWAELKDEEYRSAIEELAKYSPGSKDIKDGAYGLYGVVQKAQDEHELEQL